MRRKGCKTPVFNLEDKIGIWTSIRGYGCSPTLAYSAIQSQSDDQRRVKVALPNLNFQSGLRPIPGVAPARACAYTVVRRVFEQEAWADRALHGEARRLGLDARDLALATQLSFGTVQRMATLDYVIQSLTKRPVSRLDAPVLAALRLGVFQLTFLDRIPAHAAVGESVELAKADAPRGAGLVNAVLRRAVREARPLIDALSDATPGQASLRHSHPEWITRIWWHALGPETTRALMAANNEPAEAALRANTLRITAP